jgi:hypothetical protein
MSKALPRQISSDDWLPIKDTINKVDKLDKVSKGM